MKKMIFITIHQFENKETDGVAKKILEQVEAFATLGYEVTYTGHNGKSVFIRNQYSNKESKRSLFIAKRTSVYKNVIKYLKDNKFSVAYIRGLSCDIGFLKVLKALQTDNTRIIIEIPTYPREVATYKEGGVLGLMLYNWDKIWNKYLYKIDIDRFLVIGSPVTNLFNKPAYNISNGIDVDRVPIKEYPVNNELHVAAVAHVNVKHGYDRFIMGLKEYYEDTSPIKKKVFLHIVGSGTGGLQALVSEYNLEDYVIFHGVLGGIELDKILNKCQIAIGALAIHRCNITKGSVLKVKEYCARGIPFIVSYEEEQLDGEPFCLRVAADETPINIKQVIKFEEKCCDDRKNLVKRMRLVAEERFKWETIMKPHL